jgi:hypothetical protein
MEYIETKYFKIKTIDDISVALKTDIFFNDYLKELSELTSYIIDPSKENCISYSINDGTIVGLFVKIVKCHNEIITAYLNKKGDVLMWLSRPLYEAFVLMKYLIVNGKDSQRNYRLVSYRNRFKRLAECKMRNSAIDKVMLTKFYDAIKVDGFSEIDFETEDKQPKSKKWKLDGKNFGELHREVENPNTYSYVYGTLSEFIHSGWGEARQYNLKQCSENKFIAKLEYYDNLEIQYITPINSIVLEAAVEFLKWNEREDEVVILKEHIRINNLLNQYISNNYETNHEMYLTK